MKPDYLTLSPVLEGAAGGGKAWEEKKGKQGKAPKAPEVRCGEGLDLAGKNIPPLLLILLPCLLLFAVERVDTGGGAPLYPRLLIFCSRLIAGLGAEPGGGPHPFILGCSPPQPLHAHPVFAPGFSILPFHPPSSVARRSRT